MKNKTIAVIFVYMMFYSLKALGQCDIIKSATSTGSMYVTSFDKPIQIIKRTNSGTSKYFLKLIVYQNMLIDNLKGAKVYLSNDNNSIINKSVDVDVEKSENEDYKYQYVAMFIIDELDVMHLRLNQIVGFEVFAFDGTITKQDEETLKKQIDCLISSN